MIRKEPIMRSSDGRNSLTEVIRLAVTDNVLRIPFTDEGGFICTEIGEKHDDEFIRIRVCGVMSDSGMMCQTIEVIYLETEKKVREFISSKEGAGFTHERYADLVEGYELSTYAGDPRIPGRIAAILKRFYGFTESSPVEAFTECEVDYFRKGEPQPKIYT